jgi:hypothetical protein
VTHDRIELSEDRPKRGRLVQAQTQMRAELRSADLFDEFIGVQKPRKRLCAGSATSEKPFQEEPHTPSRRHRRNGRATMRSDQGEGSAAVLGSERELLSDHASHGHSDDVRALPSKLVQDAHGILGHGGDRAKKRTPIAVTDAEVIVMTATVIATEIVHLRRPYGPRHTEPHDEQNRRTFGPEGAKRERRGRSRESSCHAP